MQTKHPKFFNRKIPIGFVIAALFVIAAFVYSLGYKIAMDKFNNVVSYTQEKQKMYSALSEIDYNIRKEYVAGINEVNLISGLCKGYVTGLDDENCKFLSKKEYDDYSKSKDGMASDVEYSELNDDLGYIRCRNLGNNASKFFIDGLNSASSEGINKLIIDLRNSNGGDVNEAFKILQHLMPSGDIVSTVDKNKNKNVVCKSSSSGTSAKMTVLINGETCGSAEIIASALKDRGDVEIVGAETAGNAVREKIINLSDDSVLIFPDAYYVTKSGDIIFKKGIKPTNPFDLSDDLKNLLDKNELPHDKDTQLQEAIRLINS